MREFAGPMEVDSRPGITRNKRPKRMILRGVVNAQQFSAPFEDPPPFEDHPHASKVVFGVPGGGKRAFEKPILKAGREAATLRCHP